MMKAITHFVKAYAEVFPHGLTLKAWELTENLESILSAHLTTLHNSPEYTVDNNIAIHKSAVIEEGVTLKGTIIIGENCFVGANAYLRGPLFLD